jgi:formylglycine-generating enzyme required for sulfatase activity
MTTDAPPISTRVENLDPRLAEVIDRCVARLPSSRYASGEEVYDALEQAMSAPRSVDIPEGNAYRGLLAFDAEHRGLFFGREWDTRSIIERLRTEPFVLVSGASGVGKSSLCRAGILPRIQEGALSGPRRFKCVAMTPGRAPVHALAHALAELFDIEASALLSRLSADSTHCARELARRQPKEAGALLFVDQLEEALTSGERDQANTFSEALQSILTAAPGFRLLATVRGDFFTEAAALPGLGEQVSRAFHLLRPISRKGIREAIVGPARAKGFSFESEGMVDELAESTSQEEGGLPLLQFTLTQLWDMRDEARRVIPSTALKSLGGVAGALAAHAESVIAGLSLEERAAARRMLCQLVTSEGTRLPRTEAELVGGEPVSAAARNALIRGRLVVAQDSEGVSSYQLAHEVLIRGWPTLQRWVHENVDHRAARERLERAAAEWDRMGRKAGVWGAAQIAEAKDLDPASVAPRERDFLTASRKALGRAKLMRRGSIAAVPLILGIAYAGVQYRTSRELGQRVTARLKEAEKTREQAIGMNAQVESLRRGALELFDAFKMREANQAWAGVLAKSQEAEGLYLQASSLGEAAVLLDSSRKDARQLLGSILFERALIAERDRNAPVEELKKRFEAYDVDGTLQSRWNAPGTLSIDSTPSGAQVSRAVYVEDPEGHRRPQEWKSLGKVPVRGEKLASGSYVLRVSLDGYAEVTYPFVIRRDEVLQLNIDLPARSQVPEGFVYIPPGRFLTGSPDDENQRKVYDLAPLHAVETGGFLIQRTETTYAEWIRFLESLPPAERSRRAPHAGGGGLNGGLALTYLPGNNWEFTFNPGSVVYRARAGEKLIYRGRTSRAEQNWLNFPVSGITLDDAKEYLAWIRTSGRIPRARLCTFFEWERAARGADGRQFPQGNALGPDDANFVETYGSDSHTVGLDEVGSHPASDSPFGVQDMAGNVWEFVSDPAARSASIIRGGSYFQDRLSSSSVIYSLFSESLRDTTAGLRVCASLSPNTK